MEFKTAHPGKHPADTPEEAAGKKKIILPIAPLLATMTEPQGSYTGIPLDIREEPVQDADDL